MISLVIEYGSKGCQSVRINTLKSFVVGIGRLDIPAVGELAGGIPQEFDVVPLAELDEPALRGLEVLYFAQRNSKLSYLLLVS